MPQCLRLTVLYVGESEVIDVHGVDSMTPAVRGVGYVLRA
jgi:hypothetical protein